MKDGFKKIYDEIISPGRTFQEKVFVILTVIAIALAALVAIIATLMDITELIKSSTLLTTAAVSAIGLSLYKKRK